MQHEKDKNSLDLFYMLHDASVSYNMKFRKLSTNYYVLSGSIYVGEMGVELG